MTTDSTNLPNPEILKLENQPPIKESTILEMIEANRIDWLLSYIDHCHRAKHRAETLAQVYFNQMEVLSQRLKESQNSLSASKQSNKTKLQLSNSVALDLDI